MAGDGAPAAPKPTMPLRRSPFGAFEAGLAAVGTGWILVLMALICADIVGRAAFKAPILGVPEMVQFSIVGIVFLQLPLTLRTEGLTRSDLLLGAILRKRPRAAHALQLAFDLIGAALLAVIVVTTWPLARQAFANSEFYGSTGVVRIPTGPLKVIIMLGCATMALQFLLHAWRAFITSAVPAKLYEVAPNFTVVNMGAMYAGAVAINKSRWDKFPPEVQAAFRKGGDAYKEAYIKEQTARIAAATDAWKKNGGKMTELAPADQARLVKAIPNPTADWIKQAGPAAKTVLAAYMDAVRATGFKFPRDFDKE